MNMSVNDVFEDYQKVAIEWKNLNFYVPYNKKKVEKIKPVVVDIEDYCHME